MTADFIIRVYGPQDREGVRKICCDTADRGKPMESFFKDREVLADLVTLYYTDFEPESLWVAQAGAEVVGYLMGCLDTRRFIKITALRIMPKTLLRAMMRGVFFQVQTWRLLGASLRSCLMGGLKRGTPLEDYPAHLHIDIKEGFRGKHLGSLLIEEFFNYAKSKGVKGIHLSARADNQNACRFFEKKGFKLLSRHPMLMPEGGHFKRAETAVYGKVL